MLLSAAALVLLVPRGVRAGGVFVTGHDPDFHAVQGGNPSGAQHIIQDSLNYVTNNQVNSILLVTDRVNPGAGYSDPELGLTASGYTFDVADNGAAGGAVLDLSTVNFSSYSAVVVASDFGGWLRQSELDILNSRKTDLLNYVNGGGGLVAFAESGPPSGLASTGLFGFLPFLATSATLNQTEVGNQVTPFGATLGLTDADVDGNASHNIFTSTGGLNVVDRDSNGEILSLATRETISVTGVSAVPEPPMFQMGGLLLMSGLGLLRRRRIRFGSDAQAQSGTHTS